MKRITITMIIVAASTLLTSCAAPIYYNDHILRHSDVPSIGNVVTAELGAELVTQEDVDVGLAVTVKEAISNNRDMSGIYYLTNGGTAYCGPLSNANDGNSLKSGYDCRTTKEFKALQIQYQQIDYKGTFSVPSKNYKRVLEYSGKTGNTISLFYKEYNETTDGKFIRPGFTQEFKFDLSESNIIGIKGSRIEVLQANNTGITYKVISHFSR